MKNLFILITLSVVLYSCAVSKAGVTPQIGETWRAKCYQETHPMDFKITNVAMGFTTYRDSASTYKIPTYTFQREFVRTCIAGSDVVLMRHHAKDNLPRRIYSEDRSVTSR
jgi:hypothetical protein